jgi:hypothetical protein
MAAYKLFNGTNEAPVFSAATQLLNKDKIDAFLSLPESFAPGGLDDALIRCAVIGGGGATPALLAEYASMGSAEEALVKRLLSDTMLMRDMLVAGGAKDGKYGEAMGNYDKILKASKYLGGEERDATAPWDDRTQKTILHRLALGVAVELTTPLDERFLKGDDVDPLTRYLHFEKAYKAGELDPTFEVLTTFECRQVCNSDATESDMTWARDTMINYHPDFIAINNSNPVWRYAEAVHEVAYGQPVWPYYDYTALPAAGGECGPRAFFTRFVRKAWGMPTWGVTEPGHAAMSTFGPAGWEILLGAGWDHAWWRNRGGQDWYLETKAREFRPDYQKILRGIWVSYALGETPMNLRWTSIAPPHTGGLWTALMLYAKKIAAKQTLVPRTMPPFQVPSIVTTKTENIIRKWNDPLPLPTITTAKDGTITIPAVATSKRSHAASNLKSGDVESWQLIHVSR